MSACSVIKELVVALAVRISSHGHPREVRGGLKKQAFLSHSPKFPRASITRSIYGCYALNKIDK